MMESQEDTIEEEVFSPRDYQVELVKIAIKQNTIIFLPTGSGKTFIAVMVLKQLSETLSRQYSAGGKLSIILVNTVALVPQHLKYIKDHTIFNSGSYTGEMSVDFWSKEDWEIEFNKYQVLVMTSQIFLNLINNSFIDLEKVNLIIFDECHRGVEDHPMRQIMKSFQDIQEQPRVLGLTATLLNGNLKLNKVLNEVKALEITYHSKVATVDGLEHVVGYSTNPQEKILISDSRQLSNIENYVIKVLKDVSHTLGRVKVGHSTNKDIELPENLKPLESKDILKKIKNLISDLLFHIETLGIFGGYKACIVYMIQVERVKKHCADMTVFVILNYVLTMLGWAKEQLKKAMKNHSPYDMIMTFSSDKVLKLFQVFEWYKKNSTEEICALIFVKRRFTAKIVYHILESYKQVSPEFSHIKSNFIVGNNNNPYNDNRENLFIMKKNKEVLDSFINKEVNVLVSSNVLEEGVDIPKCTLVIKFDKPEEYRSYIQSKGRARHKSSLYFMIVESEDVKIFNKKYIEFQAIENLLNDLLIGKNSLRDSPSKDEIDNMYNEDEIDPYYVNGPNSAKVTMTSAVSLLCRYCSNLPRDQYTVYSPDWYLEEKIVGLNKLVRVVIILPIVCPILTPIEGAWMKNKKSAKKAAALEACIRLHKCGELNDDLLPNKPEIKEEDVSFLFEYWPKNKEDRAGFKKKKRLYNKQIPDCLKGGIEENQTLYLNVIKLTPQFKRSEDINLRTIFDLYTSKLCFGVLTAQPIPDICRFPIYDSNGCIEVSIENNVKTITLTRRQIIGCREFHFLVFNDLLEILREFLIFDNSGQKSDSLLLVPVRIEKDIDIDFSVINEHKSLKNKYEPLASDRIGLEVTDDNYLHKIVSPWYRNQSTLYVVTRVCHEKTAKSSFPNSEFDTFEDYYKKRHNIELLNPNQPLLLVKGLNRRLNVYKPVGRPTSKRKREQRYEEMEESLIPELVIKQEFPACLWIQARFLPSILSRLSYLLKLQQLQVKIARDIGAKEQYLKNCPPLRLDNHLLNYEVEDSVVSDFNDSFILTNESDYLPLEYPSLVTQQYNKDFAAKMLEAQYDWKNIDEPKDIEREIDVTVMDIEHYEKFISMAASRESRLLKNESPVKIQNVPAITYPRDFEEKQLAILSIKFDNQSPNLCQLYEALTTAEANDIVNLERLETLGDSFLKFISSAYIILKFQKYSEGNATTLKSKVVGNKNLYYLARKKNLGGILKNNNLSPNDEWVPPSFCLPQRLYDRINNEEISIVSLFNCCAQPQEQVLGITSKEVLSEINTNGQPLADDEENSYPSMCHFINKQYVGDKTLADTVEALLGVYLLTGGLKNGIKFVEWIGIIPESENLQKIMDEVQIDPVLDKKAIMPNINFHIPQWKEFESRLGYHFRNRAFLLQALTHSSYSPNRITHSYERLEFIGDAILDFLITCYIYESCGYLSPGEITDLRSALVNNNTFASLVVRCGFHKFLLMINMNLQDHIDKFADYLAMKNYEIDDEVLILLEEQDLNIAEYVDVPKVLGDIFEALAGAVYLDSGKDLQTVWKVFYKIMWKEIDLFSKNVPKNVIRRLLECHPAYPKFSKSCEVENNKTMISLEFMCDGRKKRVHGFGSNKSMAKRAAAKIALRSLKL